MKFGIIPESWAPYLLSVLRIMTGLLYMEHGLQKLFHFPAAQAAAGGGSGSGGGPAFLSLIWFAGVLEVYFGAAFVAGFFTRFVAFILSGEMAIAYFRSHAPNSFYPILNRGEAAVFYCFVYLFFAAAGPGPLSVDAMLGKRRAMAPAM